MKLEETDLNIKIKSFWLAQISRNSLVWFLATGRIRLEWKLEFHLVPNQFYKFPEQDILISEFSEIVFVEDFRWVLMLEMSTPMGNIRQEASIMHSVISNFEQESNQHT